MIFQCSSPSRLVPTVMNYYKATPPSVPPKINNLMVYNFLTHLRTHLRSSHHLNLCLNKTEHKLLIQQSIFIYTFSQNILIRFSYCIHSRCQSFGSAQRRYPTSWELSSRPAQMQVPIPSRQPLTPTVIPFHLSITAPSPKSLFQAF